MGSLSPSHMPLTDIDKGPMSCLDQPSASTSQPNMEKQATRDEVKMHILRDTKGIEEHYAHATEPPIGTKSLGTAPYICNHWYHGRCKLGEDCKFVHRLEPSLKLARNLVKHRKPCGLDRCRFKNEVPLQKKKKHGRQDSVTGANTVGLLNGSQPAITTPSDLQDRPSIFSSGFPGVQNGQHKTVVEQTQGQKRKFVDFHYDDARQWDSSRANEIDYDGHRGSETSHPTGPGVQESLRASTNLQAPPEMPLAQAIEQIIGSLKQARAIETGREASVHTSASPAYANTTTPTSQGHANTAMQASPEDDVTPPRKKSKRVKATAANETCFFWYHGHCSRSKDARRGFACPFLHELTDRPTMVQPPPGYVHRGPCMREWCPGDARGALKSNRYERGGNEGVKADASRGETGKEDDQHEDDDDDDDDRDKESQEEWFLTGFEEPE
ncbi:hypothetical protein M409DRAFT_49555 [Zasmidium cellare ATCC 36951]|uniref:C3H1-type domain-containing protein n=1 Tax=Zasmidium cellare ATCC 36951 TaxID=1080233 RepID=A0A6A6D0R3_ZASCE|nr:uncharacterized protein M409DRAFT_49555 [Zasmidium cellare ATCC 36951]KAF2173057.1 hypothetical protein M409DRAFT_49555 [Zasmidium cellare ATCC 36951]